MQTKCAHTVGTHRRQGCLTGCQFVEDEAHLRPLRLTFAEDVANTNLAETLKTETGLSARGPEHLVAGHCDAVIVAVVLSISVKDDRDLTFDSFSHSSAPAVSVLPPDS